MIPFVAIGPGPDYPAVADVEDGVVFDFSNLTGTLDAGGGGGVYPDAEDVRVGIVYGPTSNRIGTLSPTGYAELINGILNLKQGETVTLVFTGESANIVTNLTGQKCYLGIKDSAGRTWLSIEGTIVTPTGTQVVSFTLTPALAKQLEEGEHYFDVVAIYGYNAALTPPYTGLQIFTSGRVHVDRLHVTIA